LIHNPGRFQITLKLFLWSPELSDDANVVKNTDSDTSPKSGYFLVMQDSATGQGDLPGGRINRDEIYDPFERSLAREVQEELGQIQYRMNPDPLFIFPHFVARDQTEALGIAYAGQLLGGSLELSDEHNHYFWASMNEDVPEIFTDTMRSAVHTFLEQKSRFYDRLNASDLITLP
tara:strand:- start:3806 stop:4330 length:525 start_codon:yes stop_codon:yes gene_type:complete